MIGQPGDWGCGIQIIRRISIHFVDAGELEEL
jgi:hypothetical protein